MKAKSGISVVNDLGTHGPLLKENIIDESARSI